MKRLIITIEIEVESLARADILKRSLENTAISLPEKVKISTRYDEHEEINT